MSKQQAINPEVVQEIQKISQQINQLTQDLSSTSAKIWYHQREAKKNQVVLSEVKQLPADVPTYQAVGRMFVLAPLETVKSDLEKSIAAAEAEVNNLETKRTYFEKQKLEKEKNVKEMLSLLKK